MTKSMVHCKICGHGLGEFHRGEHMTVIADHIRDAHPDIALKLGQLTFALDALQEEFRELSGLSADYRFYFRKRKEAPSEEDTLPPSDSQPSN